MTTHAESTSHALTTYLRRATWGLPEDRRQDVWDELEEHLLTRADHLMLSGLSPTQAMTQAIRELGPPARVTLGMARVYTMPKLVIAAGTLALGLSAGLYALAGGGGPSTFTLPVLFEVPAKPTCIKGTKPKLSTLKVISEQNGITCYQPDQPYRGLFISQSDLVRAVHAQGGQAVIQKGGQLQVSFAGSGWFVSGAYFTVQKERYYDAVWFVSSLLSMGEGRGVSLTGYDHPTMVVGRQRVQLGDGTHSVGKAFYDGFGSQFVVSLVRTPVVPATGMTVDTYQSWNLAGRTYPHRIQTRLGPGEVVMAVLKRGKTSYVAEFSPVAADGTVAFEDVPEHLRFVSSVDQLGPDPAGGRINALLVRVTNIPLNTLKTGIFVPAQATSDAR